MEKLNMVTVKIQHILFPMLSRNLDKLYSISQHNSI